MSGTLTVKSVGPVVSVYDGAREIYQLDGEGESFSTRGNDYEAAHAAILDVASRPGAAAAVVEAARIIRTELT